MGAPPIFSRTAAIRAGMVGGLTGGVCIWVYEAIVWVGMQHQMPLAINESRFPLGVSAPQDKDHGPRLVVPPGVVLSCTERAPYHGRALLEQGSQPVAARRREVSASPAPRSAANPASQKANATTWPYSHRSRRRA